MQKQFDSTWLAQIGTLGGGNHFIELCLDEDQRVRVMLHLGSRGIGNMFGRYFIEKVSSVSRADPLCLNTEEHTAMKRAKTAKRTIPTALPASGKGETVVVPAIAPRNPFVAHALRRRAGAHGDNARTRRKAEKREVKRLLEE